MKMKSSLVVLGALTALPVHAFPVSQMESADHAIQFDWNTDVEDQWALLVPRAPMVILGTARVARTGLADAQRRHVDLRRSLRSGQHAAEGGVWARSGGTFGSGEPDVAYTGVLAQPISGLGPDDIGDTAALMDYVENARAGRLTAQYQAAYDGQDWFESLDPAAQDAAVAAAVDRDMSAGRNLDYDERIAHFNIGADNVRGTLEQGAWTFGGAIGYVRGSQRFDDFEYLQQDSKFDWDSVNLGAYLGYLRGGFYADMAISHAWHSIDLDMPVLGGNPDDAMIGTDGDSLAIAVNLGWRIDLRGRLWVEPQLQGDWTRINLQDANVQRADALTFPGAYNRLDYGKPESQRLSLGGEIGREWGESTRLVARLGARYWAEFEQDHTVNWHTPATRVNTAVPDDAGVPTEAALPALTLEGERGYTHVSLGGDLYRADDRLSGGLTMDYLSGGDFDQYGLTAHLRYQW